MIILLDYIVLYYWSLKFQIMVEDVNVLQAIYSHFFNP